jgi:hypothetical protein
MHINMHTCFYHIGAAYTLAATNGYVCPLLLMHVCYLERKYGW